MERNADLESRNTSLVQSNQDLESFAMAASHDLKEPLRTVAMYAELLSRQHTAQMDGDAAYLVNGIRQSAESISALLADLMICAEVGANRDFDKLPAVDLNEVVEKAIRNLGISAGECGASITADRLPTIVAHEIHLLQLFQNLISNAIKYHGELPPKIHITSLSTPDQLEFVVSDNGIGIDPRYHTTIFEAFKRLGSHEISGTGMGLTICQRIVSRYGGRIWVKSQNSGGTAFHFTLPNVRIIPTNRTSTLFAQPGGRPPVILLVDDNPADANLFRLALREVGLDQGLTVIDDGAAAITYLREATVCGGSGVPDILVLDLHLPRCDGIEILEAMAASSVLSAAPVLVWSSLLSPRDHQELQRFPFVIARTKPAMLEEFLNIGLTVQELLRVESGFSKASQSHG
jgi:CheY-like chemotaxis protein